MDVHMLNAPAVFILAIAIIAVTIRLRRLEWELRELRRDHERSAAVRPTVEEPMMEECATEPSKPLPKMTARFK